MWVIDGLYVEFIRMVRMYFLYFGQTDWLAGLPGVLSLWVASVCTLTPIPSVYGCLSSSLLRSFVR